MSTLTAHSVIDRIVGQCSVPAPSYPEITSNSRSSPESNLSEDDLSLFGSSGSSSETNSSPGRVRHTVSRAEEIAYIRSSNDFTDGEKRLLIENLTNRTATKTFRNLAYSYHKYGNQDGFVNRKVQLHVARRLKAYLPLLDVDSPTNASGATTSPQPSSTPTFIGERNFLVKFFHPTTGIPTSIMFDKVIGLVEAENIGILPEGWQARRITVQEI